MTKTLIRSALALAVCSLLASASDAFAQTETANLTVQATVKKNCRIVAAPTVTFATDYDPTDTAALTGAATLQVKCTKGTGFSLAAEDGLAPDAGGVRQMAFGAERLQYTLTATNPSGVATTLASDGTPIAGYSVAAVGTPASITLAATVPAGQDVAATAVGEVYTDTVVLTVAF